MKSFKQFLSEALDVGKAKNILNDDSMSGIVYGNTQKHKTIETISPNVELKHKKEGTTEQYRVLDHNTKKATFMSNVVNKGPNKQFPFKHHYQDLITKKDNSDLPKNFGSDFVYSHLVNKKTHPLVSSEVQFGAGHHLWSKLLDRSFKEGHHSYYHDGKSVTKVTPENKDELLKSSYGNASSENPDDYKKKRFVISKDQIKEYENK